MPGHTFYIDWVGNPFSPSCQLMCYDDNGNIISHNFNKTRIIQKEIIENNKYSDQEKLTLLNFLRNLETTWIINRLYS